MRLLHREIAALIKKKGADSPQISHLTHWLILGAIWAQISAIKPVFSCQPATKSFTVNKSRFPLFHGMEEVDL